jgi:hypothetical protein
MRSPSSLPGMLTPDSCGNLPSVFSEQPQFSCGLPDSRLVSADLIGLRWRRTPRLLRLPASRIWAKIVPSCYALGKSVHRAFVFASLILEERLLRFPYSERRMPLPYLLLVSNTKLDQFVFDPSFLKSRARLQDHHLPDLPAYVPEKPRSVHSVQRSYSAARNTRKVA